MEPTNQLPWIIFDLNEQIYAISTEMVTGILQFPPITAIANAPEIFLGVANIRGEVMPIIDLKRLLKIEDNKSDVEIAITDLNYKLGGIEDYLAEMRRCVKNQERFSVSGDYFGDKINLNAFPEGSQTHNLLVQIKEGQSTLEEYGEKINSHGELLEGAVKAGKELEMLIKTTVRHLSDRSKKMVITLSFDSSEAQNSVGFVVDTVRAVDVLEVIDNTANGKFLFSNNQVLSVAHNEKIKGEILVLNDREIVKTLDLYREYLKKEAEKKKQLEKQKREEEKRASQQPSDDGKKQH